MQAEVLPVAMVRYQRCGLKLSRKAVRELVSTLLTPTRSAGVRSPRPPSVGADSLVWRQNGVQHLETLSGVPNLPLQL